VNKARQAFAEGTANFRHSGRAGSRMLLAGVVLCSLVVGTRGQVATEYQVKAAFLFNFAKFVEWPASSFANASAPLRICVLGPDPFGEQLRDIVNEKMVNGRRFEIDYMVDSSASRACHILFIASSKKNRTGQILEMLRGSTAMTVGDTEGFVQQGGMINFVLVNNRVQFEVNRWAIEVAGLKISSKLLSVAKLVVNQEPSVQP
jgi:hypothetical protein